MILHLKYFGMVAEAIGKTEEEFKFNNNSVADLNELLEKRYLKLNMINYQFAVNQSLVEKNTKMLKENDEVALLPAFAGG